MSQIEIRNEFYIALSLIAKPWLSICEQTLTINYNVPFCKYNNYKFYIINYSNFKFGIAIKGQT